MTRTYCNNRALE